MVHRSRLFKFILVLAIAAMPFAAYAANVGKAYSGGSSIEWQLDVHGHAAIDITVVAPSGQEYVTTVKGGQNPSFRLAQLGSEIEDGQYTYELRVVPNVPSDVAKKLQAARDANDTAAARKVMKAAGLEPITQSGSFRVINGSIVDPNAVEADANDSVTNTRNMGVTTNATRTLKPEVTDQVIPDDLIVQGSACVGFDCVVNESFGFDTIRLKENSTRIKFEDTSSGAGFPANDWQLTANDSASGGANKFSIEDITGSKVPFTVTAGAATNSIFVDSTGRVGFRTATPVLDLHVSTSNTPAIRLEQTNAGGFTAQTWDVAGNEANFFVRDVTGGSRLPFRIRPGAPTSSVDISADGDVGIGTASPNANSHVDISDSTQAKARLALTGQEFLAASNTSTEGIALLLGVNRNNDRQLWIADTSLLTQNATNGVIRMRPNNGDISAISTNGTSLSLTLQASSGSVGIGTSSPSSKLHVSGGDIRVTGGSFIDDGTTLNVPDYVFESTYNLMPIDQLKAFIDENKHLPNVPSATSVKATGLNMSQMQMRLLEKVEELTLYTVTQHEQIGQLQAQNNELLKRLANLEAQSQKQ
jgi:hypothetical protein